MITVASLFVGLFCLVIYLVCRGGDKAFGQFMGVFLAIAFIGALVIFGGGFILLFALPLLLMIGAPSSSSPRLQRSSRAGKRRCP